MLHVQLHTTKMFRWFRYKLVVVIVFFILIWIFWESNNSHRWIPVTQNMPALTLPTHDSVDQINVSGNTVLQGEPASLLSVNGTRTLLVSAYLEHRTKEKEVRVIAIVLRSESMDLRCHLYCQEQLHRSKGVQKNLKHHFDFPYGTAEIMCPLPSGCEAPTHVAVTTSDTQYDKFAEFEERFLEVKNQEAVTDSLPYNFTVCFSTMFDFTNVLQLVQSLEMLQLLGVNRVVIYKTNCSADTQRVLDYYTGKGFVEVIPWSLSKYLKPSRGFMIHKDPGDIHYLGQMPALNDCLYRYMYRSRYMAQHDPDELILPQAVDSWLKLLPLLEKKYGADKCYMFENNVFPREFVLPPPKPQTLPPPGLWRNVSGVNILAHLYKEPIFPQFKWSKFKIIFNPRAIVTVTVHGVLSSKRGCAWVDRNIARMYHTRPQMIAEFTPDKLIYDGKLLSYSALLTPAVDTVLRESGLLPEDGTT